MKKFIYYFINREGVKTRARASYNDYIYGLAVKSKDGESCIKCSCKLDIINNEIRYLLKYGGFTNEDLRVVELIKE